MAYRKVDEASLTAVADAIRERAVITEELEFPDGFKGAVEKLVNPSKYLQSILNKTITEIACNDEITSIQSDWMDSNVNLISVSMTGLLAMGNECFYNCSELQTVNFPALVSIGASCFNSTAIQELHLPSLETITGWGWSFGNNKRLIKVDLPKLKAFLGSDLSGCSSLSCVILRSDSLCTLPNTNVFNNTPIANGTGYIYVPRALVDSYKAATNWSTYADQIRAIEDYPDITGG